MRVGGGSEVYSGIEFDKSSKTDPEKPSPTSKMSNNKQLRRPVNSIFNVKKLFEKMS